MDKNQIVKFVVQNKVAALKVGIGILVFIIASLIYLNHQGSDGSETIIVSGHEANQSYETETETEMPEKIEISEDALIIVDIGGAVENPGVVELKEGSRVYDAVNAAGGLSKDADTLEVNLAARISDGDKVFIPKKSETAIATARAGIITNSISNTTPGQGGHEAGFGALIDINKATSEQLQALNGVGPSTAQKIITHRENIGGFKKIEELMDVSGIGAKTFEKFKDKITV